MLLPKFLSRKKLSRKYRSIFASKISPATGVTHTCCASVPHRGMMRKCASSKDGAACNVMSATSFQTAWHQEMIDKCAASPSGSHPCCTLQHNTTHSRLELPAAADLTKCHVVCCNILQAVAVCAMCCRLLHGKVVCAFGLHSI